MSTDSPAVNASSDTLGTGRRKTSVARVRVRAGSGTIKINGREFEHYFVNDRDRIHVLAPLVQTERRGSIDVIIKVHGGGLAGQAGACKWARRWALIRYESALEPALRQANLLTRDSRMKERKHYGLRGARRGTQFSKREYLPGRPASAAGRAKQARRASFRVAEVTECILSLSKGEL